MLPILRQNCLLQNLISYCMRNFIQIAMIFFPLKCYIMIWISHKILIGSCKASKSVIIFMTDRSSGPFFSRALFLRISTTNELDVNSKFAKPVFRIGWKFAGNSEFAGRSILYKKMNFSSFPYFSLRIWTLCLILMHQVPNTPKKYPKIHFRCKISHSIECYRKNWPK